MKCVPINNQGGFVNSDHILKVNFVKNEAEATPTIKSIALQFTNGSTLQIVEPMTIQHWIFKFYPPKVEVPVTKEEPK